MRWVGICWTGWLLVLLLVGETMAAPLAITDPSPGELDDLRQTARATGCRLEISPDRVRALLLEEPFVLQPATSRRSIPLETTPCWSSTADYAVGGLIWLDVDRDGDLDLVSAHYEGGYPARPEETRWWRNDDGTLTSTSVWQSTDQLWSTDLTAGDFDGSGGIDLAVANWGTNKVHFHDGSGWETAPSWSSSESLFSLCVAPAMVTGDAHLDLVACNQPVYPDPGQPNHLYRNTTGALPSSAGWTSGDIAANMFGAWGDYDEDGLAPLSLTYSGDGTRQVFPLEPPPVHSIVQVSVAGIPTTDYTAHLTDGWIALWDPPPVGMDNVVLQLETSGDPDLAISVDHGNAKVYHDTGSTLESTPSFTVSGVGDRREKGVAWVDLDGDGDLDLFVGGRDVPNLLYENVGGVLSPDAFWTTDDPEPDCHDLDFVDVDRDGDLDLATANYSSTPVLRIYENLAGTLETSPSWSLPWGGSSVGSVAWGDLDSDGWPDLAIAHSGAPIMVYRNLGGEVGTPTPTAEPTATRTPSPIPTEPPTATLTSTPSPQVTSTPPPPTGTATPCADPGVRLHMPADLFRPGEPCSLDALVCNPGSPTEERPLFVVLELGGRYWYWPAWTEQPECGSVPAGPALQEIPILPSFLWPEGTGTGSGARFIGAMTDPGMTELYGGYDTWEFGWAE